MTPGVSMGVVHVTVFIEYASQALQNFILVCVPLILCALIDVSLLLCIS